MSNSIIAQHLQSSHSGSEVRSAHSWSLLAGLASWMQFHTNFISQSALESITIAQHVQRRRHSGSFSRGCRAPASKRHGEFQGDIDNLQDADVAIRFASDGQLDTEARA